MEAETRVTHQIKVLVLILLLIKSYLMDSRCIQAFVGPLILLIAHNFVFPRSCVLSRTSEFPAVEKLPCD